jgi:hypothetical protein
MSLTNTSGDSRTDDAANEVVEYHRLLVGGQWQKPHSSALIQRNYLQTQDDRQCPEGIAHVSNASTPPVTRRN